MMRWLFKLGRALSIAVWIWLVGGLIATRVAVAQDCDRLRPSHPDSPFSLGQAVTSRASTEGHFRVWYALDGEHAPANASQPNPSFVLEALAIAESAYSHYHQLGYAAVVSDQLAPCAEHDDATDIYLMDFGGSADGTQVDETCGASSVESCSGFLIIENDFVGYAYPDPATALRTVIPHEYFHLIQARYDARIEPWFSEAGAQWATHSLYPDLRDMARFFPAYFAQPERSLDAAPGGAAASFSYATALFLVFLEEAYGREVMREALERIEAVGPPSTAAIDGVLAAGSATDLAGAFQRFALWNTATGERTGAIGYADAASYPEVEPLQVTEATTLSGSTISLSSHYFHVRLPRFEVVVDTTDERNRVWYVPWTGGAAELELARELDEPEPLGPGLIVVVGVTTLRSDARFELSVRELEPEQPSPDGGVDAAAPDAGAAGGNGSEDTAPHPRTRAESSCGISRGDSALAELMLPWLLVLLTARRRIKPQGK